MDRSLTLPGAIKEDSGHTSPQDLETRVPERSALPQLLRSWNARIGLAIVLTLLTVALLAPQLAPYDPLEPGPSILQGPTWSHPFGTDRLGRDLLSRIVFGARLSLLTAFLVSIVMLTIGVLVGAIAGLLGGTIDALLMRIVDVLLAFPSLILALAIIGFFGPSLMTLMLGLASVAWGGYARLVRGMILAVREKEFITAARAVGASRARILLRHILPIVLTHVVILATLEMGGIILAISGLSFLGLGVQPPTPEWGAMVSEGRLLLASAPHVLAFPGLAIALAVFGFNIFGDGLRDLADRKVSA